jgi:hypothetical protein
MEKQASPLVWVILLMWGPLYGVTESQHGDTSACCPPTDSKAIWGVSGCLPFSCASVFSLVICQIKKLNTFRMDPKIKWRAPWTYNSGSRRKRVFVDCQLCTKQLLCIVSSPFTVALRTAGSPCSFKNLGHHLDMNFNKVLSISLYYFIFTKILVIDKTVFNLGN